MEGWVCLPLYENTEWKGGSAYLYYEYTEWKGEFAYLYENTEWNWKGGSAYCYTSTLNGRVDLLSSTQER